MKTNDTKLKPQNYHWLNSNNSNFCNQMKKKQSWISKQSYNLQYELTFTSRKPK